MAGGRGRERERGRADPTITWTPDVPAGAVRRLVVDGRLTRLYALAPGLAGEPWTLWDARPDPRAPGPPGSRFLRAFRSREAMEGWIRRRLAAGGLGGP